MGNAVEIYLPYYIIYRLYAWFTVATVVTINTQLGIICPFTRSHCSWHSPAGKGQTWTAHSAMRSTSPVTGVSSIDWCNWWSTSVSFLFHYDHLSTSHSFLVCTVTRKYKIILHVFFPVLKFYFFVYLFTRHIVIIPF